VLRTVVGLKGPGTISNLSEGDIYFAAVSQQAEGSQLCFLLQDQPSQWQGCQESGTRVKFNSTFSNTSPA